MDEPSTTDRTEQRLSALESAIEEIRDTLAHIGQRDEPTGLDEIHAAES